MLTALGKAKYFTTSDMKSGYWHIPLNEEDKEKTAFTCHRGLYECSVMPFVLANAPGIFLEPLPILLHGLEVFYMVYLDNTIIFSTSEEEHKQHIQKNFDCLRQHNLKFIKM